MQVQRLTFVFHHIILFSLCCVLCLGGGDGGGLSNAFGKDDVPSVLEVAVHSTWKGLRVRY